MKIFSAKSSLPASTQDTCVFDARIRLAKKSTSRLEANVRAVGQLKISHQAAFTMMEIAICLAIIGFALVAIIGVLPIGMNTQRDNRQATIINQDASVLLNTIRSGIRGSDDLTNYVYAITNTWAHYNDVGDVIGSGQNGYSYTGMSVTGPGYQNGIFNFEPVSAPLTNNAVIIGLLSTPELTDLGGRAINHNDINGVECYSNHVVAYVRSLSGLAAEKPPQDNPIMRDNGFSYHLYCVNAAMAVDTNNPVQGYIKELAANQRELRMTFLWPQYPSGKVGGGRHTFRATIAGQLQMVTNSYYYNKEALYFYQSQFFTNSP